MKILFATDHHFSERLRFEECVRIHDWMVDLARDQKVDLFLSGGDVYDSQSTPTERAAVAIWLRAMAEQCPILIAVGNHEKPGDVDLLARLRTRHPISVEAAAGMHSIAGVSIAAVAWPDRSQLLAVLGQREQTEIAIREALRTVLLHLGNEMDSHDGPRILLGHFMCNGAKVSTGQPMLGLPLSVGLSDLALVRPALCLMGHVHMSQRFDLDGVPYLYGGSPFRTDYGQTEAKHVVLATFDGPQLTDLRFVETPATPMLLLEATFADGALMLPDDQKEQVDESPAAEIRLRYSVASDQREPAKAAAQRMADWLREQRQAIAVKIEEEITPTVRARAPEITAARSLPDKLDALWRLQGFEPGDRRPALLDKVEQLEKEIANA